MERTRATNTNMLALQIVQLYSNVGSEPKLINHKSIDLPDDSARVRRKINENKISFQVITRIQSLILLKFPNNGMWLIKGMQHLLYNAFMSIKHLEV